MKFECGDLDRALANPDLMTEAREHLRNCATCRNEYRAWNEISATAKQLHEDWESPELWLRIQRSIERERPVRKRSWTQRTAWMFAAAMAILVLIGFLSWQQLSKFAAPAKIAQPMMASERDFLTEQALKNVETNEAAYRHSIEELSRLAQPELRSQTAPPVIACYREKLLILDSAIQETRLNVAQNRFNLHLQRELADLYRDKQRTLQEILASAQRR